MNKNISDELGELSYKTANLKSVLVVINYNLEQLNAIESNKDCGNDFHVVCPDIRNALSTVIDGLNQYSDQLSNLEIDTFSSREEGEH